jgi:CheY-like chemotaxis protein
MRNAEKTAARNEPAAPKPLPLLSRYVIFSVTLFLIIFVVGSVAFFFSTRQIVRVNKGKELIKLLEVERLKIERSVDREISIVLKMAASPQIVKHFETPSDSAMKKAAFDEINTYRRTLAGSIFWVSDVDKKFYYDGAFSHALDAEAPENYWYPMTMMTTDTYNFNINYNPQLKVTNVWVNVPVFNEKRRAVGILGTGVDLSEFVGEVYRHYYGYAQFYFFNAAGEITSAKDVELAAVKKSISEEFGGISDDILERARALLPGDAATYSVPVGQVAVISIPMLEWYAAAVQHDSIDDFKTALTACFFLGMLVVALILVLSNIFIAGLLRPLRETMESLETALRVKSDFLARMSHEIRTPLNAIMGIVQIQLQKGSLSREHENAFDKIYNSSALLLNIINDILDMSKAIPASGAINEELSEKLRGFSFTSLMSSANLPTTREQLPHGKVLVVDDVEINIVVAEGLLALYGLQIDTASDGRTAVDKVKNGKSYDIVFMDHMMPGMDGIEATKELRALGYAGAIVALTANAVPGNEEMFLKQGFDSYISKPIDIQKLDLVIARFVPAKSPETPLSDTAGMDKPAVSDTISMDKPAVSDTASMDKPAAPADSGQRKFAVVKLNERFFAALKRDVTKAAATLRETAGNGDIKAFTTTAHGMKSAFAAIGQSGISEQALKLEMAGKNGDTEYISANAGNFIETLEEFIKENEHA